MDIQAVKPVPNVVTAAPGKGGTVVSGMNSGKDLPLPPAPQAHVDPQVLQEFSQQKAAVAQQVSEYLRSNSRDLQFMVDAESGQAVIVVRDGAGNVVRRIPGEDALEMLRRLTVDPGTFVDFMA